MAVEFLPQSSLFIGIIPALALVYHIIGKWTDQYKEKIVFLMFVFGIINGFTVIFVEFYINYSILIEFIIIFRFIELLSKTMILNLRRFQEKKQTVLYGLVLGLGFGSIYPPVSLLLINAVTVTSFEIISILLGSMGMLFLQGSTGALIGYSIYKRRLIVYLSLAILLHIIFQYLLFELIIIWTWILLPVGLIIYYLTLKRFVFPLLQESKRKKRMKKMNEKEK